MSSRHDLPPTQSNATSPVDSRPVPPAEHALHSHHQDYASTPASNVASSPSTSLNPLPPLAAMSPPLSASDAAADLNPVQRYATRAPVWQFNAVAGAIGGFTSGVVTCPLDVIKTKLQAQGGFTHLDMGRHAGHPRIYNGLLGTAKVIWRDEGIRGMYRGLGPIILGYLPTWAVYFSVYQKSKGFFANYTENRHLVNMYSSVTAGATSTIVTNPIWVIKTRLMSQSVTTLFPKSANTPTSRPSLEAPWHYRSTWDAARKMYSSEGILSFYSGLTPALLGLTHVAVHIPVYELLKQQFTGAPLGASPSVDNTDNHAQNHHPAHGKSVHWFGIFAASVMSKILASSATYPHEVIRTRLQTQRRPMAGEQFLQGLGVAPSGADQHPPPEKARLKYRGVIQTFRTIMAEEGWRAFYAGMGTNLVRAVPAATVTFLTYEYVMAALNNARRDGKRIPQGEIQ